jgi:uncharacterized protein GlcG (DUF336 family)
LTKTKPFQHSIKIEGDLPKMSDITLQQALAVLAAARQKAEALETKMDIAVVDAGPT